MNKPYVTRNTSRITLISDTNDHLFIKMLPANYSWETKKFHVNCVKYVIFVSTLYFSYFNEMLFRILLKNQINCLQYYFLTILVAHHGVSSRIMTATLRLRLSSDQTGRQSSVAWLVPDCVRALILWCLLGSRFQWDWHSNIYVFIWSEILWFHSANGGGERFV